jgi:hypothetical protein
MGAVHGIAPIFCVAQKFTVKLNLITGFCGAP